MLDLLIPRMASKLLFRIANTNGYSENDEK